MRGAAADPGAGDGAILTVDLASGTAEAELLPGARRRELAGCGLLGIALLLERTPAGLDPYDPRCLLVLASGAAAGERAVGLVRFAVVAKSPLSGGVGESRVEGPFGPALRDTGYDALVVRGRARTPSYLLVEDGTARVVAESELAGLDTGEKTDVLRVRHGSGAHVAVIGPAGERRVRFASIVTDRGFAASRMGLGAVMGAKNLHAVVVVGGAPRPAAAPDVVAALTEEYARRIPGNPLATAQREPPGFGAWPAPGVEGYLGVENYRTADPGDWSGFSPDDYRARLVASSGGCPGCPQDCMKRFRSGAADPRAGVLHQEAVAAFAANLGVRDLDAVLELNARCHLWGVDQVSLSFTLSAVMEAAERDALPPEVAAGVPVFGDVEGVARLAADVVARRDLGDALAEGAAWVAARWPGFAPYAMHSKGVEVGSFDPRGSHGQALAYAVSPLGPRYDIVEHDIDFDPAWGRAEFVERAAHLGCPPGGVPMERLSAEKVSLVARLLALWSGYDALGVCLFAAPPTRALTEDDVVRLVAAVTGWDATRDEIASWGRRRLALMRAYNLREGLTGADDLPGRFFTLPVDAGRLTGAVLDRDAFLAARAQLYHELGWSDPVVPTEKEVT